jgi:hypothetical protein
MGLARTTCMALSWFKVKEAIAQQKAICYLCAASAQKKQTHTKNNIYQQEFNPRCWPRFW